MHDTPATALPEERQRAILALVDRDGRALAADLARAFGTSEDTVRRDLRELAAAGLLQRVHGGAVRRAAAAAPYADRETAAPARKEALARAVAGLIRPGEVVILDAGSTNLAVARALPDRLAATVVTNSPQVAAALVGRERLEVVVSGGVLSHRAGAMLGAHALGFLRGVRADLCVLGSCAVSAEGGVGAVLAEDAALKHAMVAASARTVTAALTGKLGTAAPFAVVPLGALDALVVEADAPDGLLAPLREVAPDLGIVRAEAAR